ncbi:hypothetical protein N7478_002780 [Penicillium angulare]|uniref:uncharacterized protein n=1 Tax=Penicillium angulare TaxID=116970 RepID=UPI002540D1AE|nr:uncharacterized protein N7478_002780 [Penicillium angulare]KAJ5287094.1 hypothetical protein N7478_002780 [Penicillium angulare]
MEYKYGANEYEGQELEQWMGSANAPGSSDTRLVNKLQSEIIPIDFVNYVSELGLPADTVALDVAHSPYRTVMVRKTARGEDIVKWVGQIGQGVIFMDVIARKNASPVYISDLTKAIYEREFDLGALRYVFASCVMNFNTVDIVMAICRSNGLGNRLTANQTWEASSSGYRALLGSKVGKSVGRFVLGAYGQGVKRIARIAVYATVVAGDFDLRFDIEDVV